MKAHDIVSFLADTIPYRRKSSLDWFGPVSVGLGLGITVGIGLGMLLAPTSGEETRRRLRHSADRVKERALGAAQRAQEQIQESAAGSSVEERSFASNLGVR